MHVETKDLPEPVQRALSQVGYGRKDIEVIPRAEVVLSQSGGKGRQGFVALVNLTTAAVAVTWGSWGGENMFDRTNPVDLDHRPYALPADGVAVTGVRGGGQPVWAQLNVPASMMARILPGPPTELTDAERDALSAYVGYTSAYRKEQLSRWGIGTDVIDQLVTRGFLTRNKAGATAVTTAGKNAVGNYRRHY